MKGRKVTLILIVSTIILWTFIGIKIIAFPNDDKVIVAAIKNNTQSPLNLKKDTDFLLSLDYEDPFLSPVKSKKVVNKSRTANTQKKKKEIAPKLECRYIGLMKKGKKNIAVLHFQNKNLILSHKKSQEGITLISAFSDSVKINYKGFDYTFHKMKSI